MASPKPTVVILGASNRRTKFGNKSVRAHLAQGYKVYPVNPHEKIIEGCPVFSKISDIPDQDFDRVSMYVPPAVGIQLIPEIAAKGCKELWLNPGSESPELIALADEKQLNTLVACSLVSLVSLGISPQDLDE